MAKGSAHYVKHNEKKPYLKKSEWIALICICSALVIGVSGYFLISCILDDSLDVKSGKIVGASDNWIICNEGAADNGKYYKYGEFDFTPLDAAYEVNDVNGDDLASGVYVYPNDKSYEYAYVYANKNNYAEISETLQKDIGTVLEHGDVHQLEPFTVNGVTGNIYWYTNYADETDANGEVSTVYTQIFSCYMPSARDGCVILRIAHKGDSEEAYVEKEKGFAEMEALVRCVKID